MNSKYLPGVLAMAAIVVAFDRGWLSKLLLLVVPLFGGLHLWFNVQPGIEVGYSLLEFELTLYRTDRLSLLFGYVFHIAAFIAGLFALHVGIFLAFATRRG